MFIFIIIATQIGATDLDGAPASNIQEHRVFIGFNDGQSLNHCTQVISRFSGKIIEKLREFAYPVFLVKIDHSLSPDLFQKQVLTELEQEKGVRFVSLERKSMKDLPIMEIKSTSIQRRGNIRIAAPKKTKYDFVKNSTSKNAYYSTLERHLPGLKANVTSRALAGTANGFQAVFELDIDKEGEVHKVRMLSNNISNREIRNRLKEKIYTWKDFPRRTSDDLVTVRFKFNSQY
jgi:hypothetical protein